MRIRELRQKRKISQRDLAKVIGKSQQAINFYENGTREPGVEVLIALADFFETTIDDLVGRIPNFEDTQGDLKDLLIQFRQLSPDGQADIVQYAKFIVAKESAKN